MGGNRQKRTMCGGAYVEKQTCIFLRHNKKSTPCRSYRRILRIWKALFCRRGGGGGVGVGTGTGMGGLPQMLHCSLFSP